MSYQVVPCHRHYTVFLQQALMHAHYLPPHYKVVPILFCDIRPYHLIAQSLIIDNNGDIWYSHRPLQLLSQNVLQDQHCFVPFHSCLGSPLWLNVRYCSYFQMFQDESNPQTAINYGLFYYHLNPYRDLSFIYPLSIHCKSFYCLPSQTNSQIHSTKKQFNINLI